MNATGESMSAPLPEPAAFEAMRWHKDYHLDQHRRGLDVRDSYIAELESALMAQAADAERLRSQLEHWKTFAVHAEGEHAAWKKTATELDEELRALKRRSMSAPLPEPASLLGMFNDGVYRLYTAEQMHAFRAEGVAAERERWELVSAAAIEALEWHASKYCKDSMPQETIDALAMLRDAAAIRAQKEPT